MIRNSRGRLLILTAMLLTSAIMLILIGCSDTSAAGTAPQMPPPEVEVVRVEQKDVPIYHEWIGTLDGMVNAAIKAQVTGYLLTQNYTEGSFVRKGQLLFEIDPRPFQAALRSGAGATFPGQRPAGAGEGAIGSVPGAARAGAGESAPHATGRGSLYSARQAAGDYAAGPG